MLKQRILFFCFAISLLIAVAIAFTDIYKIFMAALGGWKFGQIVSEYGRKRWPN